MIDKEVRPLLAGWAACALGIIASRWQIEPLKYLAVPTYFFGTAALGALSIGQEYAHRTLPSLLTMPVPRHRIWTVKLLVVAPMLATLAVLGAMFAPIELGDQKFGIALFVLPPLVSLFVAPWLTMLARGPIAGAVFTFGAIGGSIALGEWIGVWRYGPTSHADAFQLAFVWWALSGLSAVGAVMGWRTFARLEADDSQGPDIELLGGLRRTGAVTVTPRHPLLALLAKELHLQQLPMVIAALWAVAYAITEATGLQRALSPLRFDITVNLLSVLTAFYALVLPAVIGSLACAEERNIGTLDSQLLLPVSATRQWIVKAATALCLAIALTVVVPTTLARAFHDVVVIAGPTSRVNVTAVMVIAAITAGSLYMSTVARSGIRALLGSFAAFGAFGCLVATMQEAGIGPKVFSAVHAARAVHVHPVVYTSLNRVNQLYSVVPQGAFLLLILAFAGTNYRSSARSPRVLAAHGAIFVACVVAYSVAMSVVEAFHS